jgi:hypothetical protein
MLEGACLHDWGFPTQQADHSQEIKHDFAIVLYLGCSNSVRKCLMKMLVVAKLLSPFCVYLTSELKAASDSYATSQWSKLVGRNLEGISGFLGDRKWPLKMAATCEFDLKCRERIEANQLPCAFRALPRFLYTVNMRHFVFRLCSRMQSYLHEYLELLHAMPPFTLLKLPFDESGAAAVLDTCDPMLDSYSRGFTAYWRGRGGIASHGALLELAMVIAFGRTNTCRIESLNALLRRMVSSRYQTWAMSLLVLSAKFVLSRLKLRLCSTANPPGLRGGRRPASKVKKKHKRQRREGGGGAWRAFVRARSKLIGKAVFRQFAGEYATLDPAEKAHFEHIGRLGTIAHRSGKKAFGLRSRSLQSLIRNSSLKSRCKQLMDGTMNDSVAAASHDLAVLGDQFAQAKADFTIMRSFSAGDDIEAECALADWSSSVSGVGVRDAVAGTLPAIAEFVPEMHALPSAGHINVSTWCSSSGPDLHRTVALLKKREHEDTRDGLMSWFDSVHKSVNHDDQAKIPPRPSTGRGKPTCREAKVCLCGDDGAAIHTIKLRLCDSLKICVGARGARLHAVQCDGDLVCRLTGMPDGGAMPADLILHIPFTKWSPYSPSFRFLQNLGINSFGNIELFGQQLYMSVYELCKHIHITWPYLSRWQLRLYSLVSSERGLTEIDGRVIEVALAYSAAGIMFNLKPTRAESVDCALDELSSGDDGVDELVVEAPPEPAVESDCLFSDGCSAHDDVIGVGNSSPRDVDGSDGGVSVPPEPVLDCDLEGLGGCASPVPASAQSDQGEKVSYICIHGFFCLSPGWMLALTYM